MNRSLIGAVALVVATHAGAASMQDLFTVDALYDQGRTLMAPDWKPLVKANGNAVFVHDGFRKTGKSDIAAWIDRELVRPEYFNKEKPYLSIRERALVDCKSGKVGRTESEFYAEHFGGGLIVGADRDESVEMLDAVPDSIEDRLMKVACAPTPHARVVHRTRKLRKKVPARKVKPSTRKKQPAAEKAKAPVNTTAVSNPRPL